MDPGVFYGKFPAKVPPDYSDDSDLDSSSDDEPESAASARACKHSFYCDSQNFTIIRATNEVASLAEERDAV